MIETNCLFYLGMAAGVGAFASCLILLPFARRSRKGS